MKLNQKQRSILRSLVLEELTRLHEAPKVDVRDDDDQVQEPEAEQPDRKYDPTVKEPAPQNPAPPADTEQPEAEPDNARAQQTQTDPTQFDDPEPQAEPAPEPQAEPQAEPEAEPAPEPQANDAQDQSTSDPEGQRKLTKTKVRMFFDKLGKNDQLMNYLQFNSPIEQAEAIQQFSELVGVPRTQLVSLMTQMRQMAKEKQVESMMRKVNSMNISTKQLYNVLHEKMGLPKSRAIRILFEVTTFGQYKKLSESKKKVLIRKILK